MGAITSRKPSVDAAIRKDLKRMSHEYSEGKAAFADGVTRCPYNECDAKAVGQWWDGWLDARTLENLGPVFARRGISWP